MRSALLTALASIAILGSIEARGAVAVAATTSAHPRVVLLHDHVADVDAVVPRLQGTVGFRADHRYRSALRGFSARLTDTQRAALLRDPAVRAVAPDITFTANGTTALAPGEAVPAALRRIRAATTTTAGTPGSAVAVLDTGIDLKGQPDLVARHGVNCLSPGSQAQDDNGHGTHVAGTIAARNQGSGVVGVAPATTVYAVKVLNSRKTGTLSQILCGIDWVSANASGLGIRVANMSISAAGSDDGNCGHTNGDLQHQAICRSTNAGVLSVASAGNNGADFKATAPASYREVLTVSSMNDADGVHGAKGTSWPCKTSEKDDRASTSSNYATTAGQQAHLLAAPGTCIVSTKLGGGTVAMSGTSMAAPHVSGTVARCLTIGAGDAGGGCGGLTPAGVIVHMRQLAASAAAGRGFVGDPLAPLTGRIYGHLVDANGL